MRMIYVKYGIYGEYAHKINFISLEYNPPAFNTPKEYEDYMMQLIVETVNTKMANAYKVKLESYKKTKTWFSTKPYKPEMLNVKDIFIDFFNYYN